VPKSKPLIAIIDDDESMRGTIKGFVRSLGYRVEGVGQIAIEKHDVSFKSGGPSLPPGVNEARPDGAAEQDGAASSCGRCNQ
jgi:hypothetical protein